MTSIRVSSERNIRLDRGFKEELKTQRQGERAARQEDRAESRSERVELRGRRRSGRGEGDAGGPPTDTPPAPPTATIQPVPNPSTSPPAAAPPTASPPVDDTVKSMAEKYVDIYTQQSGRTLSSATREALVNDVASFYGENGGRTERLRGLVGVF